MCVCEKSVVYNYNITGDCDNSSRHVRCETFKQRGKNNVGLNFESDLNKFQPLVN